MNRTTPRLLEAALLGILAATTTTAIAAGCSSTEDRPAGAAEALADATGVEWIVSTNRATGAIAFAAPKRGPFSLGSTGPLEQTTLAFLAKHRAIFKMHDPAAELVFERTTRDDAGASHVRFQQKVGTVPVRSGTWTAHFDNGGRLTSMSGAYQPAAHTTNTAAKVTADQAAQAAKEEVARRAPSLSAATLTAATPTLEVSLVAGGVPVLAWVVDVTGSQDRARVAMTVRVDAGTGSIQRVSDAIVPAMATGRAPQTYPPYEREAPDLTFPVSDDNPPVLVASGVGGVEVITVASPIGDDPPRLITARSTNPWEDDSSPPGVAIAAQANANKVLEYLHGHTWNGAPYRSFDGEGTPLTSFINAVFILQNGTRTVNNAVWDQNAHAMRYGDGTFELGLMPLTAALDCVAHEIFHGVSAKMGLALDGDREEVALHESISDAFAALVTHRVYNDDATDFTIAEGLFTDGIPARSMIQPTLSILKEGGGYSDVETMEAGTEESHLDSNVPSHAFYLMTHGDTHARSRIKVPCGIGWAAADRLYWSIETSYLQSGETFHDFALHSLAAARALSINERPVACAWVAVGVLSEDEAADDWNVTCERDGAPEAGAGDASDGDASANVLISRPAQLVECQASLTGDGASLGR